MKARKISVILMAAILAGSFSMTGCGQSANAAGEEVVIYSNADDEAVEAMKKTLDENGYEGKYLFQTFGTSELGGKAVSYTHLFTDNLYLNISRNAIQMAERLKALLHEKGLTFYLESPTNQQFVILENETYKRLREHVALSFWSKYDEAHTVVRFATSWSTTEEDLEELEKLL